MIMVVETSEKSERIRVADDKYILYRTPDLYFSAYLCALDVHLETTEEEYPNGKRKVVFVFKVKKDCLARMKAGFFGGTATVRALTFTERLRSLKMLCHV